MANGNELDFSQVDQAQSQPQEETQIDKPIHVANAFGNWGPKIVKDPNVDGWKGYGIEVPDINFDFLKIDVEEQTPEEIDATDSLKNSWNSLLDQLSLTDDRFYQLSEQLFGDLDSITAKEAQARIDETEEEQAAAGGSLALEDIPDAFEDEGLVGGLAHMGAAVAGAGSSFVASAIQGAATFGAGLAVDMVQGSVQDYTRARAEEDGVSYKEAADGLGADTIIPIALGTVAYKFEKAGIKGVGKAIKGMAPGARRAFVQLLNASGKEGGTELAQGVVEAFNQGLGAENDLDDAAEKVSDFWEHDALETFLQGAVGGGVSTGGGQAVRRAASRLRSKTAEDTIDETSKKMLEIDRILNNPETPEATKAALQDTRNHLKKKFKDAIQEPNDLIRKLDDSQVEKINKHGEKIDKLKNKLSESRYLEEEDADAYGYLYDDINEQIYEEGESINKVLEDAADKLLRDQDGEIAVPHSTEKADALDVKLKEGDKSDATFWEAVDIYKPLIKSVAKGLYKTHKEHTEQAMSFEDFVSELTHNKSKSSFYGVFKDYDGRGSFRGYAKEYLTKRGRRVLDKAVKGADQTTGLESASNVAADGTKQEKSFRTRKIVDRLGFSPEVAKGFEDAVSNTLKTKKLTTATRQGFDKALSTEGRKALRTQVKEALGKDTKANPEFTRNLIKNAEQYRKIIPPIAYANSRGETQDWANNPPSTRDFINYFRGLDQTREARYKRRKSLTEWIADGIFAEAANDLLQDPNIAESFELAQEFDANPNNAIASLSQARAAMIGRVALTESRIMGPKFTGYITKRDGATVADSITSMLDQAWKQNGHNVTSTTSRVQAIGWLKDNGYSTKQAKDTVNDVHGFTFKDDNGVVHIYNDSKGSIATPIHEMGHVWSQFLMDHNPQLWGEIMTEIISDQRLTVNQSARLESYRDKFGDAAVDMINSFYNSPETIIPTLKEMARRPAKYQKEMGAIDELFAGIIEKHGKNRLNTQEGSKLQQLLDKFWDAIGKLLANVKGKEIKDLTTEQLLDLALNDITTGKPGSSFAEMNIPVGTLTFDELSRNYRKELSASQKKEQNMYDALTTVLEGVKGDKSARQAIDDAYKQVADQMTEKEFLAELRTLWNQSIVDNGKLQDSLLVDDAEDVSAEASWTKIAGGKTRRLGVFTRQPKGSTKEEFDALIAEKHRKNAEFFDKHFDEYTKALPKGFWRMLQNYSKDGEFQANASALSEADAQRFIDAAEEDGRKWDNTDDMALIKGTKKLESTYKKDGGIRKAGIKDLANDKAYNERVDQNQDVMFAFGDAIQQLAEAGIDKTELGSLTRSFLNPDKANANIFRRSARLVGYSGNLEQASRHVPEHNPPAGYIAQFIYEYASKGQFNEEAKQAIRDKFGYWQIDHAADPQGAFIAAATKDFNLLTDDPIVRYLAAGVDVTGLKLFNGKTLAEEKGIDRKWVNEASKEELTKAIALEVGVKPEIVNPALSESRIDRLTDMRDKMLALKRKAQEAMLASSGHNLTGDQLISLNNTKHKLEDKVREIEGVIADLKHQEQDKALDALGDTLKAVESFTERGVSGKPLELAKDGSKYWKGKLSKLSESKKKKAELHAYDFDDTLFSTNSRTKVNVKDGESYYLTAEEFAKHKKGANESYDFTEFDQVIEPKALAGFKELEKSLADGNDVVILTARTMKAGDAINKLMKEKLGDKAKNIKFKGVGHSSADAKANYLINSINKHGYDNVFFTDDAIQNVEGVQKRLDEIKNVESRTKLAVVLSESRKPKDPSAQFNEILEQSTGVKAGKTFDAVDIKNAEKKFRLGKFWLPPSAEDLKGLIYSMIPGGKEGNAALEFFNKNLFEPYSKGIAQFNKEKLAGFDNVKALAKAFDLNKDVGGGLTAGQAVRINLFIESGQELEGVSDAHIAAAVAYTKANPKVKGLIQKVLNSTNGRYDNFEADTWLAGSLEGDMYGYFNDVRRKELMQEWKDNKDAIFTKENLDKLRVTHGKNFVNVLEGTFARQWSGRNRSLSNDPSTNRVMDWLNNAASTLMFWNSKSATLQSLSSINMLFEEGKTSPRHFFSDIAKIWNSDYLRARRGDSGFDLSAQEIAESANSSPKKLIAKLIQFGFTPTQLIDSFAIALGGARIYRKGIADGLTHDEAMHTLQELSEENQQSARPDKISQVQSGPLGRLIFAFGNTPFQYARLTKRGIQDLMSGRSSDRGTFKKDAAKILWYGAVQSVIFTMLQNAVDGLLPDEDDDEDEKRNKAWALDSFITSYVKAMGGYGAIASGSYSIFKELNNQLKTPQYGRDGSFLLAATSISPPIQSRLRKLLKVKQSIAKKDPQTEDYVKALGYGLNVGANIPLDRVIDKFNNLKTIVESEAEFHQQLMLALGWKPYQLGVDTGKNKKKEVDFSSSDNELDFSKVDGDLDFSNLDGDVDFSTPINRLEGGETGQAFRDGTIEVDPNLSPVERQKTINHEMVHVKQMQEDGLDYDDDNIYYKGKKHRRRNGKIRYNGRWHEEGAKQLPWEAEAYAKE